MKNNSPGAEWRTRRQWVGDQRSEVRKRQRTEVDPQITQITRIREEGTEDKDRSRMSGRDRGRKSAVRDQREKDERPTSNIERPTSNEKKGGGRRIEGMNIAPVK